MSDGVGKQLETAIGVAMAAAKTYEGLGNRRDVVIALNAGAQAASALGDHDQLKALTGESLRIAAQFGYADLAQAATELREKPTLLEQYERVRRPVPYTELTQEQREDIVERLLHSSGLEAADIARVRPVLRQEVADHVSLDKQHEEVCQYLALLKDLRVPRVGPFHVKLDWRVTCRMRGVTSMSSGDEAERLLHKFTRVFCSGCAFRSPGPAGDEPGDSLDEIYAPLLRRLAGER